MGVVALDSRGVDPGRASFGGDLSLCYCWDIFVLFCALCDLLLICGISAETDIDYHFTNGVIDFLSGYDGAFFEEAICIFRKASCTNVKLIIGYIVFCDGLECD